MYLFYGLILQSITFYQISFKIELDVSLTVQRR